MTKRLFLFLIAMMTGYFSDAQPTTENWYANAAKALAEAKRIEPNTAPARNVILFVGDGMGISTITAARILEGQQRGEGGEENSLSFEKLPFSAFSKTYSANQQVPDSAPTMTAMVTGVKTKSAMISVNANADKNNFRSVAGNELPTIAEIAKSAGKSVGIVTTTRVTHATPAACFGHSPHRDWECDSDLPMNARTARFPDLALQLVEFQINGGIDLVLGGGRGKFLPKTVFDPEETKYAGERSDDRNLIHEWEEKSGGIYLWNKKQFDALSDSGGKMILGLFSYSHMHYEHDRTNDLAGEPSLAEMAGKAVRILRENTNGFFLMVEAGRIDHAHHAGNAYRALTDTIQLSAAVTAVLKEISLSDTLVIVTADHSHTMTIGGYPQRGNDILGKVTCSEGCDDDDGFERDGLNLPFTTLSYANGPGYAGASNQQTEGNKKHPHAPKHFSAANAPVDLSSVNTADADYMQLALSPLKSETHAGEDVAIFAGGPNAHLFRGVVEQNYIFHVMLDALRLSPDVIKPDELYAKFRRQNRAVVGEVSEQRTNKIKENKN